jgi:hypothetical protein
MEADITLALLVTSVFSGGIGYALRTLWDSYIKRRDFIHAESWKIKAEFFEERLSKFYWPLYLRLQRDNVVWKKILDRFRETNRSDEERRRLAFEIERSIIIPNHLEMVEIIFSGIHLASIDKDLEDLLMAYLRHVDVYTSIRSAGINNKDPISFGEPWPKGLFEQVERRLRAYQIEYEEHLRDSQSLDLDLSR